MPAGGCNCSKRCSSLLLAGKLQRRRTEDAFGMHTLSDCNLPFRRRLGQVGLGLALALTVSGCTSLYRYADPPRVTLAGIRILDLTLFEQRYLLALRVQNPNSIELPIEGMSYTLNVNGMELARGVSNQKTTIPAFGEQVLQISVVASTISALNQLRHWQQSPPKDLAYQLKGKIQLADVAVSLPFEYSGKISLQEQVVSPAPD